MRVRGCRSAAAAERRPFDVVLVDMHMPGMDGVELMQAIQADRAIACVRRIMLSFIPDELKAKTFSGLGIDAYLTKPVRQAELLDGFLADQLQELRKVSPSERVEARYQKFRRMGKFGQAKFF